MDLSNIKEGLTVKNYKALCELLNEPIKTGKSKQLQLSDWERFFSYTKDKNKFIINEIYNSPLDKIDKRIGNGGVRKILPHSIRMERILMYQLNMEEKGGEIFLPISVLLEQMNIVNSNYKVGKRNVKKVSKYLNIEEATVEEFFDYSRRAFKYNIESMLNRLRNKSLIFWNKVITVCVANVNTYKNDLGKAKANIKITHDYFGNEEVSVSAQTSTNLTYRAASNEEIELILHIEGKTLDKLGCTNKQEVVQKKKWDEFINTVNSELFNKANILYYYDSYKIIRNEERLSKVVENNIEEWIKDEIEYAIELICLNNDFQAHTISNAINRHEKALKDIVDGIYKEYTKNRMNEDYLNGFMLLTDNFINSGFENIKEDIRMTKI